MPSLQFYYRPQNVPEALQYLTQAASKTVVVAGGTFINANLPPTTEVVVDLQTIGLTAIIPTETSLTVQAMVTLQTLVDTPAAPETLRFLAHREAPNTFRNVATIGGVIAGASPHSELLAALLVMEAVVTVETIAGTKTIPLAELLPNLPQILDGGLITAVTIQTGGTLAADRVGRTPADTPIVAAVARQTPSGQTLLALCGVATLPVLVDPARLDDLTPPADFLGSADYRRQMAKVLAERVTGH